jgi:hypothetical protein
VRPSRAALALAFLAGCGPAPDATVPGGAPSVPWADYAPGVRSRIDRWAEQGECAKLIGTRETAEAAGQDTRRRTGHDNTALLAYLDHALERAGCAADGDPGAGGRPVPGAERGPDGWRRGPATTGA